MWRRHMADEETAKLLDIATAGATFLKPTLRDFGGSVKHKTRKT
jgi:hypothetical protein